VLPKLEPSVSVPPLSTSAPTVTFPALVAVNEPPVTARLDSVSGLAPASSATVAPLTRSVPALGTLFSDRLRVALLKSTSAPAPRT
jgi:hypothetical protein